MISERTYHSHWGLADQYLRPEQSELPPLLSGLFHPKQFTSFFLSLTRVRQVHSSWNPDSHGECDLKPCIFDYTMEAWLSTRQTERILLKAGSLSILCYEFSMHLARIFHMSKMGGWLRRWGCTRQRCWGGCRYWAYNSTLAFTMIKPRFEWQCQYLPIAAAVWGAQTNRPCFAYTWRRREQGIRRRNEKWTRRSHGGRPENRLPIMHQRGEFHDIESHFHRALSFQSNPCP